MILLLMNNLRCLNSDLNTNDIGRTYISLLDKRKLCY